MIILNFRCTKHLNSLWFVGDFRNLFYSHVSGFIAVTEAWRYMFTCPLNSADGPCTPINDWESEAMNA